MTVEKVSDDLWIGVKGLSNWEIAGSPRNILRYSLVGFITEVELLDGLGSLTGIPKPTKLRIP